MGGQGWEIKKAYRRESLKHHTCLDPYTRTTVTIATAGDKEQLKLVVEANALLSDSRRRERYDIGEDEDGMSEAGIGVELFVHFHGGLCVVWGAIRMRSRPEDGGECVARVLLGDVGKVSRW
jgi:DnaJ-class molecular chaperone